MLSQSNDFEFPAKQDSKIKSALHLVPKVSHRNSQNSSCLNLGQHDLSLTLPHEKMILDSVEVTKDETELDCENAKKVPTTIVSKTKEALT